MDEISVIKRNFEGKEVFRYRGRQAGRLIAAVLVEAHFSRPDMPFFGFTFGQGDRMVEAFYGQRWFNIFQIHDRDDDHIKGWYCNVAMPAVIEADSVSFVDLALDLLVFADGRQLVLDEDEFSTLPLDEERTAEARKAISELQTVFARPEGFLMERDWQSLV